MFYQPIFHTTYAMLKIYNLITQIIHFNPQSIRFNALFYYFKVFNLMSISF